MQTNEMRLHVIKLFRLQIYDNILFSLIHTLDWEIFLN